MDKNKKITSSQLDTSKDSVKIQPINLSEEVKLMMTGKSPVTPQIPYKSLVTEYYADNSVTSKKRTAAGSVAVIVSSYFCNFNTIGDNEVTLSIPKDYTIYFGTDRRDIVDNPESLTISKGEPSIIIYNKLYGFGAYPVDALHEDDFIIGAFDGENVTMFNGRYTINGSIIYGDQILDGATIKDFSIDSRKFSIQHGMIISDKTYGSYINVNFTSNFIEVVKSFDISIADQYSITIKDNHECRIPENTYNKKYLYIYYDLGIDRLNALWSSVDIGKTIINNNEKLVLLGIIDSSNKTSVGINNEFISVNSVSLKYKKIEYIDIFTGKIIIDFKNKKITKTIIVSD